MREEAQRLREVAAPGLRVPDEEGEGGGVQLGVLGAAEQGEGGGAQQGPVALGGDPLLEESAVPGGGRAAGRAVLVAGPAFDGPAEHGGLVLREGGEELTGARVRGGDQRVGQIVDGQGPAGVEQGLRGVGHGGAQLRVRLAGAGQQGALVGEPAAEQGLYGGGVEGQAAGHGVEVPLVAVGTLHPVGGDEAAQQVDPVLLGQPEPPPEPGPNSPYAPGLAGPPVAAERRVIRPARTRRTPR
ncbi:hypothetical protein SMICM304S_02342 [Streptomyces microflavus]